MKNAVKIFGILAIVVMICACSTIRFAENNVAAKPIECDLVKSATRVNISELIMFDFDKATIRKDQISTINKITNLMNKYPDTALVIGAYASSDGPKEYNLALSQRRANAVRDVLIKNGVSADRIHSAIGKGETSIFGNLLKMNRRAIVISVE